MFIQVFLSFLLAGEFLSCPAGANIGSTADASLLRKGRNDVLDQTCVMCPVGLAMTQGVWSFDAKLKKGGVIRAVHVCNTYHTRYFVLKYGT